MIKIAAILLLLFASSLLAGEPPESDDNLKELLETYDPQRCETFGYNASVLIPRYYEEGKIDSIRIILDFIEVRCGQSMFRQVRTLLAISDGSPLADQCDGTMLDELIHGYSSGWDSYSNLRYRRYMYLRSSPDDSEAVYWRCLTAWAETLSAQIDSGTMAFAILQSYLGQGDVIRSMLIEHRFAGTCLQERYDRQTAEVRENLRHDKYHWAIGSGIWIPLDNASKLGNKVDVIGQLGRRWERFGFDLSGALRFSEAPHSYFVRHNGSIVETKYFLGFYIGGGPTYTVTSSTHYTLELFGEVGYDAFHAIPWDHEHGNDGEAINSYAVTLGMSHRFFFNDSPWYYFGIQARYSIVGYYTHGGSDLSGNTISLDVLFGFMANKKAFEQAKALGVK